MLRNHLGKEAERDLAGASEYLGDREGTKEHKLEGTHCSLGYLIWIKVPSPLGPYPTSFIATT